MKNKAFWFVFTIFFVAWALYELNPPTGRNLIDVFEAEAHNADTNLPPATAQERLKKIVADARKLEQAKPDRTFANLHEAIGTNVITNFFAYIDVKAERDATRAILNRLQVEAAGRIKLGLDLQGGTSFLVMMDTNALKSLEDRGRALDQAVEVLRRRVDRFGVAEPLIQPAGEDRILIQLPGLSEADKESAKTQIQKAAFLEFRLVHPDSDELVSQGVIEPGYQVLQEKVKQKDGREILVPHLVKKKAERGLTGKNVKRAMPTRDPMTGEPEVDFTLDSDGASLFAEITRENVGRQLAIVLDGELYSAPVIRGEIPSGRGSISGGRIDMKEAQDLANVLENPLEAPVKIVEERGVDPSLGKDSIRSGIKAAVIGTAGVAGFMLVYYLFCGLVANVALMLNIVVLLGVMCSVGTTLTLPGIAGIVLTIGMAVDANVLIFERIREELAAGKSLRGALNAGYSRAFGTIFDSNLTTLIASIILIFMGTGPVKGFGVALTIGVSVSMFTALIVTRLIFDWLLAKNWLKGMPMLHVVRGTKFDFLRWAKPAFAASWTLIIIGIGWGLVRGHEVLGVDFAGGDRLTLRYAQQVDLDKRIDQVRDAVTKLGVTDAAIQVERDLSTGLKTLRITCPFDKGALVEQGLMEKFPEAKFERIQLDKVGAIVGKEIQKSALIAALLALFGILVYVAFRYEFSFAVGAVVAILHDILMTMGWFFLSGRELSAPIVAAILTIIGFSINDTIVIFDRIREDLKLGLRGTFKDVMNQALNQTLSRTLITSGTVFLSTMSLFIFGGGVINDFAFTFLVGIITGTYSSVYIASALVLWWHKGERPTTFAGAVAPVPA
ncbi:MAG: protein translocase subunit SecD [Verrucomicrobia bacterium]|nr:protein translocase subunit SecD [Verrucomicrobiota bacterium]